MLKNSIIQECLTILKRDDIKKEVNDFFSQFIQVGVNIAYPYTCLVLFILFLIFFTNIAILIILIKCI
jgi:hypothetical protein